MIYHNYEKIHPDRDIEESEKIRTYKVTNTYYVVSLILTFSLYVILRIDLTQGGKITYGLNEIWILTISFVISNLFLFCTRVSLLCKKCNFKILNKRFTASFIKKCDKRLDKTAEGYIAYVTNFLFSISLAATLSFGMYSSFLILFYPKELEKFFPPTKLNINLLVLIFIIVVIFLMSYLISYFFALISESFLLRYRVHDSCITHKE